VSTRRVMELGKKYYIYGLIDPHDYKVRYVGRTSCRMDKRLTEHIQFARRGDPRPVYDWIRSILPGTPLLVCLETCSKLVKKASGRGWRDAAEPSEVKWIKRFRRDCLNDLGQEEAKNDWRKLVNS
jgi:hypothetical protein